MTPRKLPNWQSRLVSQIAFCMEQNYISFDEISPGKFIESLTDRFAKEFAHLDSEEKIMHEYKKQKEFTMPDLFLTSFKAEARDRKTRLEILQKEISKRVIIGDAIILNGEGDERSIYVVKKGHIIEDNLFKGMPLTQLRIPENLIGTEGKLENSQKEIKELIDEAIKRTAYTQFAEEKVTKILFDLTNDLHLSCRYCPDEIKQNSEYLKKEKDFPPLPPPKAVNDQYGFYEDTGGKEKQDIPSNIGYVRLSRIYDPTKDIGVQEKAFEMMRDMQKKDAVIIDLRNTGGGTPEGVQYLLSFFFKEQKEQIHLNTVHMRNKDKKYYFTLPLDKLNPNKSSKEIVDLSEKPVYILVGKETFSAAEEFAYDLQQLNEGNRFIIVGERTKGGAHPCEMKPLLDPTSTEEVTFNEKFYLTVPIETSINPYSHTNWEDGPKKIVPPVPPGVQPDAPILEDQDALQVTIQYITEKSFSTTAMVAKNLGVKPSPVTGQSEKDEDKKTLTEDEIKKEASNFTRESDSTSTPTPSPFSTKFTKD